MDIIHRAFELLKTLFDAEKLPLLLVEWGWLAYILLVAIVFAESGLFFGFFLPGDSLLFIAGFVCGLSESSLSFWPLALALIAAAIIGDTVGYWFGRKAGPRIFTREDSLFFHKKHLFRAQEFYEKHGGKTIIYARFVPIVRTFAPIVAGAGNMKYSRFISYNVFGGIGWVLSMMTLGYYLGALEIVKKNLEKVVLLVIFVSILPIIWEMFQGWRKGRGPK